MTDVQGMESITELEAMTADGGSWSWCGFMVGVVIGQVVLLPVTGGLSGAGLPLTGTAMGIACSLSS